MTMDELAPSRHQIWKKATKKNDLEEGIEHFDAGHRLREAGQGTELSRIPDSSPLSSHTQSTKRRAYTQTSQETARQPLEQP